VQELRKGRYLKMTSTSTCVLLTVAQLGLPVEPTASSMGVTLLPTATVEQLMLDRRRHDLLQPFKLALLKFISQARALMRACMPACWSRRRSAAALAGASTWMGQRRGGAGADRPAARVPQAQEAASLMGAGDYEGALAAAMDAVKQGQALFKGGPALQMFPLYLLAAQVRAAGQGTSSGLLARPTRRTEARTQGPAAEPMLVRAAQTGRWHA
jgi:hypothetical protein